MKTQELKIEITQYAKEIKSLKKILRQSHDEIGIAKAANSMFNLKKLQLEVRALYWLYGWYRGKKFSDIERIENRLFYDYYCEKKLKEKLSPEAYTLLQEWKSNT